MSPAQFAEKLHALAAQLGETHFAVLSNDVYDECIAQLNIKNGAAVMEAEGTTIIIPGNDRADTRNRAECLAKLLELCFDAPEHINAALMHPEHPGFPVDEKSALHYRRENI